MRRPATIVTPARELTVPPNGDNTVEYVLSPADYLAQLEQLQTGEAAASAGLLPQRLGDPRAQHTLARLFKSVTSGYLAGSTFAGRLERRLAVARGLVSVLQMRGPFGRPLGADAAGGAGADPPSLDPVHEFTPMAVMALPLREYQEEVHSLGRLAALLDAVSASTHPVGVAAAAASCVDALQSLPCLSLFRQWALLPAVAGAGAESALPPGPALPFDFSRATASSSLGGPHAPAAADPTCDSYWQSGAAGSESFWRCPLATPSLTSCRAVSFTPIAGLRPKTVKLRGTGDGISYVNLTDPVPVPDSGDLVIIRVPDSAPPVVGLEVVLYGPGCESRPHPP